MALQECGLLKFFKVQGMRAQLRLLEYLVHMWDVNEQAFHVGVHTSRVSLSGSRGGENPWTIMLHTTTCQVQKIIVA
jgi:hypothetical protein